jgi:hypothetical protein
VKIQKSDVELIKIAVKWLDTNDPFHLNHLRAELVPMDRYPTDFAALCHKHLIEFPDDPHYANHFRNATRELKANHSLVR